MRERAREHMWDSKGERGDLCTESLDVQQEAHRTGLGTGGRRRWLQAEDKAEAEKLQG